MFYSRMILPVIMCGGAGTRLWPASRESMPKQFMPLLGRALELPGDAAAGGRSGRVRPAGHRHGQ